MIRDEVAPRGTVRTLGITNRHPRLRFNRNALRALVATLDRHADKFRGGCPAGELSVVFLTDSALAKLHGDFLGDPTVTDVITFEGGTGAPTAEEQSAGEICVSVNAAIRQTNSKQKGRTHPSRFSEELALYVVHGWLHLAGYDDLQPAKKRLMRRAEQRALKLLRETGRLPSFSLASGG